MLKIEIVQDADEAAETYPAHADAHTDELGHPVGNQPDGTFLPFAVGESTDAIQCLACVAEELNHLE